MGAMRFLRFIGPTLLGSAALAIAAQAGSLPAPPPMPGTASAEATSASAAESRITVTEDKQVRIEETRVRGQLQRVVVKSKLPGARPYEIIIGPGGHDPSKEPGASGQSAWSVLNF